MTKHLTKYESYRTNDLRGDQVKRDKQTTEWMDKPKNYIPPYYHMRGITMETCDKINILNLSLEDYIIG